MILRKHWKLFNEVGAADGGGGAAPAPSPSPAPAPSDGGSFNMEGALAEMSSDIFGNNGDNSDLDPDDPDGNLAAAPTPAPAPTPAAPAPTPAAPAPTPAPAPAPAGASPAPAPGGGTPPRFTADAPPTTWSKTAADEWANISPAVREEIAKRENDMFSGLAQYREEAGFARTVKSFLQPIAQDLTQHGVKPEQFMGSLVNAHLFFASTQVTPEQKQQGLLKLAADYGVTLPTVKADDNGEYTDPQVAGLQSELAQLRSRLSQFEGGVQRQQQAAAEEARGKLQAEIEAFAEAHPDFYDVADDVAALIKASGGKMSLKEAHEKAVWANPVTRAKEVAKREAEAMSKAEAKRKAEAEAAEAARKGRVRSSGHQGGGTAASGSMDDTMEQTMAEIRRRERS